MIIKYVRKCMRENYFHEWFIIKGRCCLKQRKSTL